MPFSENPPWLHRVVLASAARRSGTSSQLYRSAARGAYERLAEGVYLPASTWATLGPDDRFLARIHGLVLSGRDDLVFSHTSAAALWRLPIIGSWPLLPEVTVGATPGGQTRRAYTSRKYPLPSELENIDGVLVTPLARTLVDVGRTSPMSVAVAMVDRVLAAKDDSEVGVRGICLSEAVLATEVASVESKRGMRRCRTAIDFADGRSGSPGESLSRVAMHVAGLPRPELQHPVYDGEGLIGITDFWWPEFGLAGEFDGHGKYLREDLRDGRSPAEVVIAEKVREDRMRATGIGMVRWGWSVARSIPAITAHLRRAGLR
ncbi:hypothetical protein [Antiquaquibacter soli]|uniref:Transcriptional regulator, AbiEi antitoxin, Type IV TA system n=1 Tax=Antiquaquibacter soli TaxID=3064523 RepID=A0ABT9BJ91_9MICO|nr:hypothetical protein [Protaetiibacter sp. WY-16]MDO7881091.1 hypothetical protein [Protaetiibacter sp. WY-16]